MKKVTSWIFSILFVIAVGFSLLIPYKLMSSTDYAPLSFSGFFIKFCIVVLPIFIVWLGLLLSKGNWRGILNHIRTLIVFVAIFLVASFSLFKWTNIVNTYGVYGHYVKNAENTQRMFGGYIIDQNSSSFEKETVYRGMMENVYNLEFKKMWTFGTFVFLSAFLLLLVIPKKDN